MIHKVTKQGLSAAEFPAVGKFMEKASTETLNAFQFPECQSTLISEQAEKSLWWKECLEMRHLKSTSCYVY